MATEAGQPVPAGVGADRKRDQKPPPKTKQAPQGEAPRDKKPSNAELKKKAKEDKAARRAAAKAVQASQPPGAPALQQQAASGDGAKGAKAKPRQDALAGPPPAGPGHHYHVRSASRSALPPVAGAREAKPAIPQCFSHLPMARRIPLALADKDVHPAVLALGQHMGSFAMSDSMTRLEATLLAFKKVIDSYSTPLGASLSRHFTSHVLNPQIEYLTACRPMCFSMGNAIRWLKLQISRVDIDLPDAAARKLLCAAIDGFVRERITLADFVIVKTAADMVDDGDHVLTYAHHHLVERALLHARADGKRFRVTVVDDAFDRVGAAHAKRLVAAGIPVAYASDLGALRSHLAAATLVLAAAEAMFSNGAMYARAGTADVAAAAADVRLRVVALCESINFTERVAIDSLAYNEIDPDRCSDDAFRLLFDTTRDKFLSVVVTELGNTSARSVPAILRKLEEL